MTDTELNPDFLIRLRTETAAAHQRLEDDLGLLSPPLTSKRFRLVLERFYGFYRVWDPAALQAFHYEPDFIRPSLRLAGLVRDLRSLGATEDSLAALPEDTASADLLATPSSAMGSLYVVEGSALGGQLINRALAGQTWLPPSGLTFFSPHGADTGRRWHEVRERLRAAAVAGTGDAIVTGAANTFARLHHWMQPVFREAEMSTRRYP